MDLFVGLDVSQQSMVLCVVDAAGHQVWQGQSQTNPASRAAKIRRRAPNASRIGFESGPLSTWLWHELGALGLPIVCIDARHAKAVLAMQINKSNRNDALGLAQIVRSGASVPAPGRPRPLSILADGTPFLPGGFSRR